MTAELDYLKATVLSPSMENVIMYSDMPMEEMSKDPDFPKNGCLVWRCFSKRSAYKYDS